MEQHKPDAARILAQWLSESTRAVFFGGAGVSTESGVPDFRSETGLYKARQAYGAPPETLLSHGCLTRDPGLFFRYYKENLLYPGAKPNACHLALAALERRGILAAVVTQNIDGLHQAAGSKRVLELHGSNDRHTCLACGRRYDLAYVLDAAHCPDGYTPRCACGGMVRPDVVLYGENLDSHVLSASVDAIAGADLLVVGGTSLAVYPAAGLLRHYHGERLVVVNKSETAADRGAALVVREPIAAFFANVAAVMEAMQAE